LLCAFEKGPEQLDFNARNAAAAAIPFVQEFDTAVDADFFPVLWRSLDRTAEEAEQEWQSILRDNANRTLRKALNAGPRSETRRFIAAARAESMFAGAMYKQFPALRHPTSRDSERTSTEVRDEL